MKKSLFPIVLFGLIVGAFSCPELDSLEKREAMYGKASPIIHQSYAAN